MKKLLIIGARGFGREIYNLYLTCFKAGIIDYQIKGFLDDKTDALNDYKNYPPILSSVEDYEVQEDDVFICALGDVNYKKKYVEIIQNKGGEFISLIHPLAEIGQNSKIGKGCIIRSSASISCDVMVGDFVTIMAYCVLGHDVKVADWSHIGAHCFMGGYSILEEMVTLHPCSKILPHKIVKKGSCVGAGSVVLRNVKEHTTVFGMPAKKVYI